MMNGSGKDVDAVVAGLKTVLAAPVS